MDESDSEELKRDSEELKRLTNQLACFREQHPQFRDDTGDFAAIRQAMGMTSSFRRRMPTCSFPEEYSPPGMSILDLVLILLIPMLVLFMFRKPLANLLKKSPKPSFTRPRGIRKKAP